MYGRGIFGVCVLNVWRRVNRLFLFSHGCLCVCVSMSLVCVCVCVWGERVVTVWLSVVGYQVCLVGPGQGLAWLLAIPPA